MIPINNSVPEKRENKFLSTEFKKFFLLEFTKQLILSSSPMEVLKLKEVLREENYIDKSNEEKRKRELKERVKEIVNSEDFSSYEKSRMPKTEMQVEKQWAKPSIKRKSFPFETFKNVRLTIPESNLPPNLRYLRPTPTDHDVDLGKLNPLIKDPFVRTIECIGANNNLIVKGKMGEKKTQIVLDEEEINEVINKFSSESRIPVNEGVYKIALGRLIFMAVISEVIGSKFIINKMLSSRIMPPGPFSH
jgi:hypothetical protein